MGVPLGALRALLAAAEKPMAQARDIGQAFLERGPLAYFERYRAPAEDMASAAAQYGVNFSPRRAGSMEISDPAIDFSYYADTLSPRGHAAATLEQAPSLVRTIRDMGLDDLYEINAQEGRTGSNIGGRFYPAILDAFSGGMGKVNVPTQLTRVNEMRRNANMADALIRNPRLENTVLPIDSQLDAVRLTPEDYMGMGRAEKVGALTLAHAAKALKTLDDLERVAPQYKNAAEMQNALRRAAALTSQSSRAQFADPALSPLYGKAIGPSTLKRLNLVDALLREGRMNPDLWSGLAKAEGGAI